MSEIGALKWLIDAIICLIGAIKRLIGVIKCLLGTIISTIDAIKRLIGTIKCSIGVIKSEVGSKMSEIDGILYKTKPPNPPSQDKITRKIQPPCNLAKMSKKTDFFYCIKAPFGCTFEE